MNNKADEKEGTVGQGANPKNKVNRPKIAFLASGHGTTFEAVALACKNNRIYAEVGLLITSRDGTGAEDRATKLGIDVVVADDKILGLDKTDELMRAALRDHDIDFIILAGFIRKVGPKTLTAYSGKIFNTHPAPLPHFGGKRMYGNHVHEAVLNSDIKLTAATIHMVTTEYDDGPIIAARPVPVIDGDNAATLKARVQAEEKELLIMTLETIAKFASLGRQANYPTG